MSIKRKQGKQGLIGVVIILVAGGLLGNIKVAGKLSIPTAVGEKSYDAFITVTRATIGIQCAQKIFQPLNRFDEPKQAKISVNTAEIEWICIQGKEMFIFSKDTLLKRYRNLFHQVEIISYMRREEKMAILFVLDHPEDIDFMGKELIKIINQRSREQGRRTTCGDIIILKGRLLLSKSMNVISDFRGNQNGPGEVNNRPAFLEGF